jgi:hypothetical protein
LIQKFSSNNKLCIFKWLLLFFIQKCDQRDVKSHHKPFDILIYWVRQGEAVRITFIKNLQISTIGDQILKIYNCLCFFSISFLFQFQDKILHILLNFLFYIYVNQTHILDNLIFFLNFEQILLLWILIYIVFLKEKK